GSGEKIINGEGFEFVERKEFLCGP
ncbi:MAG: hypothetical protein H6Q44_2274, partial [Deltaproteobacteria bacterium]|nr:hypothetical protein [Deltaproteobacteria bacterium]